MIAVVFYPTHLLLWPLGEAELRGRGGSRYSWAFLRLSRRGGASSELGWAPAAGWQSQRVFLRFPGIDTVCRWGEVPQSP